MGLAGKSGGVLLSGITENGDENGFGLQGQSEYDVNLSSLDDDEPGTHKPTPTHIHTCIKN
jgi:hypothetical protein